MQPIRARRKAKQLARAATLAAVAQQNYPGDPPTAQLARETLDEAGPALHEYLVDCNADCAIYCGDVIFWAGLLDLTAVVVLYATYNRQELPLWFLIGGLLTLIVNAVRLLSAYRQYMRFEHVVLTIVAAQVVLVLAIFTALVNALYML